MEQVLLNDPSNNTLLDSFHKVASSMKIPDEFEYTLEGLESDTFTYLAEDTKMFQEHPGRGKSSQSGSRSHITIGNSHTVHSGPYHSSNNSNEVKQYAGNYDLSNNIKNQKENKP